MNFIDKIIEGKLEEAKQLLFARLNEMASKILAEEKQAIELVEAAPRRNPNIQRMGRIQKIRRRIRRNTKGRIVVQKNVKRSAIKGYRVSGNTIRRIPATERLRKARLLKRSWKTTRRAKIKRTLLKRKMSMRRRASMGLR